MATSLKKYQSVITVLGLPLPAWVADPIDAARVAAYDGYQDMIDNVVDTFKVPSRNEEGDIYVPSAGKIVEAVNRYLGKDWQWSVNSLAASVESQGESAAGEVPGAGPGPAEAKRLEVQQALARLFVREEVPATYYSIKRNMTGKGDAFWHLTVDQAQIEGERISITELDARQVFKIQDPSNIERVLGYYVTDLIAVGTAQIARRLEYRKPRTETQAAELGIPLGKVYTRLTFWEPTGWDDRAGGEVKAVPVPEAYAKDPAYAELLTGTTLPDSITQLPIYHHRNKRKGGDPWGTSQISGLETLINAVNGTITDEDLTLALQGIGVYATNAKRPIDPQTGEETDWYIAPGAVLELTSVNDKFERVNGVGSVQPFQDHYRLMKEAMEESAGLSAVSVGRVDAAVAQSGVALRLEMASILSQNEEKELDLLARMDQMLHDLVFMWLPLDGIQADPADISVTNSFGDPLPINREAVIKEVTDLVTAGLMSKEFAVEYLSGKLGYQFPSDMVDQIRVGEDRIAARMAAELGLDPGVDSGTPAAVPPASGPPSPASDPAAV